MAVNTLLCGDTLYAISDAYRSGAVACRESVPFFTNPHRDGSQRYADWSAGHDHEAAGLHRFADVDVVTARRTGTEFVVPDELLTAGEAAA
jgi:hypothetical protein